MHFHSYKKYVYIAHGHSINVTSYIRVKYICTYVLTVQYVTWKLNVFPGILWWIISAESRHKMAESRTVNQYVEVSVFS